jgi:signal transduction histidine kinase
MIRSFRFRLALLSALLTGFVLVAFGFGSWWLIRTSKIERIDSELRRFAEREVARRRSEPEWRDAQGQLLLALGVRDIADLALFAEGTEGETFYRSAQWPAGVDSPSLPWPNYDNAELMMPSDLRRPDPSALPALPEQRMQLLIPRIALVERVVDGQTWRIAVARANHSRIAAGMNVKALESDMNGIRNAFLLALPFALGLLGLSSWYFASRALRPVKKLTEAAQNVTAAGLDQRLTKLGEDREFAELIEVFNRMLGRLERSFEQANRFTADAAHELKTPLAIVQGQLERAIAQADEDSSLQAGLTSTLDEVRRLSVISRKLLLLSQADAGRLSVFRESVDLTNMLEELLEDTRMLAPNLSITGDIEEGLTIQADSSLLRQVMHNLISNALKYNIEGGWVRIRTHHRAPLTEVVVCNSSTGIAVNDREKIFERFFRADSAHNRHIDGVGLGLSVSREIARAHGGDLLLDGETAGQVQFTLLLFA